MPFKPCGECTECCDGNLIGKSYGNDFYKNKPCIFLVNKKCSIYKNRPQVCRSFQCAWTQNLLDDDMRPDKCGIIVSIEADEFGKQYFKVIETNDKSSFETLKRIDDITKELGTTWKLTKKN